MAKRTAVQAASAKVSGRLPDNVAGAIGGAGAAVIGGGVFATVIELGSKVIVGNYGDNFSSINGGSAFVPTNPNYVVSMIKIGTELSVRATSPQEMSFTLNNDYQQISTIAQQFMGNLTEKATRADQIATALSGASLARIGSFELWTGAQPFEFNLPLRFDAYSNPLTEVVNPVKTVLMMAAATADGAAMQSPGPTILDARAALASGGNFLTSLKNSIAVRIGNSTTVAGLVITSVNWKYANRAERKSGLPISAEVDITLRSALAYTKSEFVTMFGGTGFGLSASAFNVR